MRTKIIVGVVLACLVVLWSRSHALAAEEIVASLLISSTVVQGEPVPVTVRIKNVSQEWRAILIPAIRRFGPDTVMFGVQSPGDAQKRPVQRPDIYVGGLKSMPPASLPVRKLSPGEVVEYPFSLVYEFPDAGTRKRLFDKPGPYVVEATVFQLPDLAEDVGEVPYDAHRRAVSAGSADVEIVSPKNQRDKDALHALRSIPDEYLIYEPFAFRSELHAEAAARLKEYREKYSDTELGRRAALPLGIAVAEGVVNDVSGAIRKTIESLSEDKQSPLRGSASTVLEKMAERNQ